MYSEIFDTADELIVTNIYAAGEKPFAGIDDKTVFDDIKRSTLVPISFIPYPQLIETLTGRLQTNDLLLTLGAGNITLLGEQLLKVLEDAYATAKEL